MKILVNQITERPTEIQFSESVEDLNQIYADEKARDFRFPTLLDVNLVYYRSGRDLFLDGSLQAEIEGSCSRCLENYSLPLEKKYQLVLIPDLPLPERGKELNPEELGLSTYQEPEINLSPLIKEQVLLALPIRPLCEEHCRGLCAGCGANLNDEACRCVPLKDNGAAGLFRTLRVVR